MTKLRMFDLYPDVAPSTKEDLTLLILPSWSSARIFLADYDFEVRYVVEALLSHGIVSFPEIQGLSVAIRRMRQDIRLTVLEGLFMWTRKGSIEGDLKGLFIMSCQGDLVF